MWQPVGLRRAKQRGFTLMELILVIVLLGVVGLSSVNFIQQGLDTYLTSANRQAMSSTGRFVIERLSREFRAAVPGSVNLRSDLGDCVQFRPIDATLSYLSAPIQPQDPANGISVMPDSAFAYDATQTDYTAIIYPLTAAHSYSGSDRAVKVAVAGYNKAAGSADDFTLTLAEPFSFAQPSPAQRLFIAHQTVTFCRVGAQLYRFAPAPLTSVNPQAGVLMAERFSNTLDEPMFSQTQATFSTSSMLNMLLKLNENGEDVVFNHEVHLLQTP